ncbi:hypothetical protein AAVH_16727 [Aphelenchoides avenae]|nr:hypothetical protein AAVH_16727 [Aphelenchus avenae]
MSRISFLVVLFVVLAFVHLSTAQWGYGGMGRGMYGGYPGMGYGGGRGMYGGYGGRGMYGGYPGMGYGGGRGMYGGYPGMGYGGGFGRGMGMWG